MKQDAQPPTVASRGDERLRQQPTSRDARPRASASFEWTAEELRAVGHRVVDLVAEHLTGLPDGPVFRPVPAALVREFESEAAPIGGTPAWAVLDDFAARVAPWPFGNGHPRFYGWVNPPPHPLGVFAEALAAAMNPSVAGGNHAAVHVERQVVRWFIELAGLPDTATGLLLSGGSAATLTGLAVARHRAAFRAGLDVRRDGLQAGLDARRFDGPQATSGGQREGRQTGPRFVMYQGSEGHGAARKAAELLGIGSGNVRVIGSDERYRMRLDLLRSAIESDLRDGHVPVAVFASAGTVNTGAIDNLGAIADICAEHGVWLHVDAAYGGPAVLLLEEHAAAREGLARADSIALDPHKWLYAPVGAGLVLIREARSARDAFSLVPEYLRTDDDPAGVGGPVWFSEYGFEQTRPFRALKVWMLLRHLGVDGYRELVQHDMAVAAHLAAVVREAPDLELLAHGLSVVCFRCRPDGASGESLDAVNRQVLSDVQLGGSGFLSGTTIDGVFALRACVVNPRATVDDVEAVVGEVRARLAAVRREAAM